MNKILGCAATNPVVLMPFAAGLWACSCQFPRFSWSSTDFVIRSLVTYLQFRAAFALGVTTPKEFLWGSFLLWVIGLVSVDRTVFLLAAWSLHSAIGVLIFCGSYRLLLNPKIPRNTTCHAANHGVRSGEIRLSWVPDLPELHTCSDVFSFSATPSKTRVPLVSRDVK